MRAAENAIEQEGIGRARASIEAADLVLLVLDRSEALSAEDEQAIATVRPKRGLMVLNKADLPAALDAAVLSVMLPDWPAVAVSCLERRGLEALHGAMLDTALHGQDRPREGPMLTKLRHWEALCRAEQNLRQARQALDQRLSGEFIALDLRDALEWLGDIVGLNYTEDLLDRIFSEFCIGK
jgi:tRNA modification GTPase